MPGTAHIFIIREPVSHIAIRILTLIRGIQDNTEVVRIHRIEHNMRYGVEIEGGECAGMSDVKSSRGGRFEASRTPWLEHPPSLEVGTVLGDLTEVKYNAANILNWWTQRKSNAEMNSKSSAPPRTEESNPSMNQTRNIVGVGPDEIVQGNNSDTRQASSIAIALLRLSHGWRSVPPYSVRRSSRKRPKKIAKTTNERGKAGRHRTLGYVYSDEEPDAFDQT
ncbi:hypothetical protein B0H13DRAFT_1852094 [Mycena leptocephala]|nr:hypothetical protein B0H13DRAFT_1852094 [Mycena leptocephala]